MAHSLTPAALIAAMTAMPLYVLFVAHAFAADPVVRPEATEARWQVVTSTAAYAETLRRDANGVTWMKVGKLWAIMDKD